MSSNQCANPADPFAGLQLRESPKRQLQRLHTRESFAGKTVLEIGTDIHLSVPRALLNLGARLVYALNPRFEPDLHTFDPNLVMLRCVGEDTPLPSASVDFIFGCAVVEHLHDIRGICRESKRLLRPGGLLYLQGSPLWTSPAGHHTTLVGKSGKKYGYNNNSPWERWEHLTVKDGQEARERLKKKNIPGEDMEMLIENLFASKHVSRKTPEQIGADFTAEFGENCEITWSMIPPEPDNWFFTQALVFHAQDELVKQGVTVEWSKPG